MPDIFDIAGRQVAVSPVSSFMEGRRNATVERQLNEQISAMERNRAEDEANAPLRAKQREAQMQAIDYAGITAKLDTTSKVLGSIVDDATLQSALPELQKINPDMAAGLSGGSYDELKPMLDKINGNIDPVRQRFERMAKLEASDDPLDKKILEYERQLTQLEGERNKLDMQKLQAEVDAQRALAEQRRAPRGAVGAGGGRGTAGERAGQTVRELASIWESDPESLTDDERIEAADALDARYPMRSVDRKMADGSLLTVKSRNIPEPLQGFAQDILGNAYGSETRRGQNDETIKQREEREKAYREMELAESVANELINDMKELPEWFFGGYGTAMGMFEAGQEWATGKESEYKKQKQKINTKFQRLVSHARVLTGEGKVMSDYDRKALEEMAGKDFFATKASAKAAMDEMLRFVNAVRASYARNGQAEEAPEKEKSGGTQRTVSFDDWINE